MPSRLLAIDAGTRVVGFALADAQTGVAAPLYSCAREGELADLVALVVHVAKKEQCRVLVFGMPSRGPLVKEITETVAALRAGGYEVGVIDEHLTSRLARLRAAQSGEEVGRHDDAWAAVLIAEDWLGQQIKS